MNAFAFNTERHLVSLTGVKARSWNVMKGDEAFFGVTKAFHNALHGRRENITEEMLECYRETTEQNLKNMDLFLPPPRETQ